MSIIFLERLILYIKRKKKPPKILICFVESEFFSFLIYQIAFTFAFVFALLFK